MYYPLIATHNSATSEPSKNWFYSLFTPFTRCQSLSIIDQYREGVTYFDLCVRFIDGRYQICHGLWVCSKSLDDILSLLTILVMNDRNNNTIYVSIFYEGTFPDEEVKDQFVIDMKRYTQEYRAISFTKVGVKKPEWQVLMTYNDIPYTKDYLSITGWRRLLPIPYLNYLFRHDALFNSSTYTMVDFY